MAALANFAAYGIRMRFRSDGLRRLAEMASTEQTGARGLMTVCEQVLRDFKYELPSSNIKELIVNRRLVDAPETALRQLLSRV